MPGKLQGPLNLFGRWLAAASKLYGGISIAEIARRSEVNEKTLRATMAESNPGPSLDILHQVFRALEELAQASPLRESFPASKAPFYNIAGRATPEQQDFARLQLLVMENYADQEEQIQQLEKRLRSRSRPRSS